MCTPQRKDVLIMNILLAIKGFEQMPNMAPEEELHIVFSKDSTVPAIILVSMLDNRKNITPHFLDDKHCDNIAIAMLIGKIAAEANTTEVTVYCPTEMQVKTFDGIKLDDISVRAKKIVTSQRTRKTAGAEKPAAAKEPDVKVKEQSQVHHSADQIKSEDKVASGKGKKKSVGKVDKIDFLMSKGIEKEFAEPVIEAIENSSDAVIGFEMQLKTKLAVMNRLDQLQRIKDIVNPSIYGKLKK